MPRLHAQPSLGYAPSIHDNMGSLALVGWRSTGGEQLGSATSKGPLIATRGSAI